ncbi:MAG: signal recognition particle protein Srp54 [Candidatus Nezhaarchaeales archaeon]|nr:MAG: signal recognition particle protein [Candidatus Nezhaarchaeota archaeon WYZ-LMO8]TDA34735.1 MAG: signal recognition particle protein [Candidatus Nezhaarchaeota archaeon WYZ-LMO7]
MLSKLGTSLREAIKKFLGRPVADELAVKELIRDVQRALLLADVNVELVLKITQLIEERALKEPVPSGFTRREVTLKVLYESLVELLGGEKQPKILYPANESITLMLVGVQGSGKTTTAAKLAWFYKSRGYRPGIVCADTFRPGAYDQLKQLALSVGVPFYGERTGTSTEIALRGINELKKMGCNVIIIDTAGRHKSESTLMEEMKLLSEVIKPSEVILVVDATIGQQAKVQAEAFNNATKIGSIIVTKLDGAAKGGGALSAVVATGAQIKFIGIGEKIDELEIFDPPSFVSRLLGMGDLKLLAERVKEASLRGEMKSLVTGKFTLKDMVQQLEGLKKLGPLRKVLEMIPGFGLNLPDEIADVAQEKLEKWTVMVKSMTKEELEHPEIINRSRMRRIARGSGVKVKDVKELLETYEAMKRMMKNLLRKQKKGRLPLPFKA